ncbi:site-specific integrase [Candidatus Bipolaricaulota bacterium]|nr:site-specific integrase [Candidatus Bipolaricaulota bacterium]
MKKGENWNHPAKGSSITVEPIRNVKDIKAIKRMLAGNPRDYCIFVLGINTNLRASDILNLRVCDVWGKDELVLKEKKTGKIRRITLNDAVRKAINNLLASMSNPDDESYLFLGLRGNPLTVPTLSRMVKTWCQAINLPGNYGSHSLRKTWGYHQRVSFGMGLPELMVCFNHSSQRQTLDYLCVQPEEVRNIYLNVL